MGIQTRSNYYYHTQYYSRIGGCSAENLSATAELEEKATNKHNVFSPATPDRMTPKTQTFGKYVVADGLFLIQNFISARANDLFIFEAAGPDPVSSKA